jgi:hypothetical protein
LWERARHPQNRPIAVADETLVVIRLAINLVVNLAAHRKGRSQQQ